MRRKHILLITLIIDDELPDKLCGLLRSLGEDHGFSFANQDRLIQALFTIVQSPPQINSDQQLVTRSENTGGKHEQ